MKIFPALLLASLLNLMPHAVAEEPAKPAGTKAPATVDVTPEVAAQMMKGKAPVQVVDVRTPDEFAEGHIPGALNVDFLGDDFEKQLAALPTDRPLIVHCAAGNRSAKAVAKLVALKKFTQIFHLKSGFNGWKAAGKPVETKAATK